MLTCLAPHKSKQSHTSFRMGRISQGLLACEATDTDTGGALRPRCTVDKRRQRGLKRSVLKDLCKRP